MNFTEFLVYDSWVLNDYFVKKNVSIIDINKIELEIIYYNPNLEALSYWQLSFFIKEDTGFFKEIYDIEFLPNIDNVFSLYRLDYMIVSFVRSIYTIYFVVYLIFFFWDLWTGFFKPLYVEHKLRVKFMLVVKIIYIIGNIMYYVGSIRYGYTAN